MNEARTSALATIKRVFSGPEKATAIVWISQSQSNLQLFNDTIAGLSDEDLPDVIRILVASSSATPSAGLCVFFPTSHYLQPTVSLTYLQLYSCARAPVSNVVRYYLDAYLLFMVLQFTYIVFLSFDCTLVCLP
jgi:hypothetical protein